VAALRWAQQAPPASPWLHEEVARRMQERLQWIRQPPQAWAHWQPLHGGLAAHHLVVQRYPQASCYLVEPHTQPQRVAARQLQPRWWQRQRWWGPQPQWALPPAQGVDMVWANMGLHMQADPLALMVQWQHVLATDGFLMFSCLGPDSLRGLRALYARLGWPTPAHACTDMHDWGDMLVQAGFAQPVMDMERIVLGFASAARLLQELRGLGRNLHPARFPALRTRAWRARLEQAIDRAPELRGPDGALQLEFEVIYGHAFKAAPRVRVEPLSAVSLRDMQALLRNRKAPTAT